MVVNVSSDLRKFFFGEFPTLSGRLGRPTFQARREPLWRAWSYGRETARTNLSAPDRGVELSAAHESSATRVGALGGGDREGHSLRECASHSC